MNFTATFAVFGLVVAAILIVIRRPGLHGSWVTLLNWFLLVGIGITYLYNGIMHTAFGEYSAELIGWEDNGFQAEVGFASFGMGLLGIMAALKRMPFSTKFAGLIVPACFLWGAAAVHIQDIIENGNMSSHNAGTVLYTDIFIPIIGFVLWGASYLTRPPVSLSSDQLA
ncbi:MAG TPA: hypothetical protein PLQ19_01560 [Aeromicrobium sp.]|nr:hypothetical protein [Aeromicrobium sp.]